MIEKTVSAENKSNRDYEKDIMLQTVIRCIKGNLDERESEREFYARVI